MGQPTDTMATDDTDAGYDNVCWALAHLFRFLDVALCGQGFE